VSPVPNFRPETSLYAALPALALVYGRTIIDTPQEDQRGPVGSASPDANGAWGQIIGRHVEKDGHPLGIFGSGPSYEGDFSLCRPGSISIAGRWQKATAPMPA
jgi:hypothetical protein